MGTITILKALKDVFLLYSSRMCNFWDKWLNGMSVHQLLSCYLWNKNIIIETIRVMSIKFKYLYNFLPMLLFANNFIKIDHSVAIFLGEHL